MCKKMGISFRGGPLVAGVFERWSISSQRRVQITSESVRLITLIHLNMFWTHNVSSKSSRKCLWTTFWRSVFKKWLKWPYSVLSNRFSKVLCIKPKSLHLPPWWMWPSFFFFFISPKNLSVASFGTLCLFKTHYSDNFRRYEEMKAICSKREDVNSSILCIKMY